MYCDPIVEVLPSRQFDGCTQINTGVKAGAGLLVQAVPDGAVRELLLGAEGLKSRVSGGMAEEKQKCVVLKGT